MKAEKGNREYSIDKSQKKFYQDRGFDIKDDDGKVITYGRGKTVPYGEYEKVAARNKELEEQAAKLREELDAVTEKPKQTQKEKAAKLREELDAVTEKPKQTQKEKAEKGSSADAGESSKKG